MIQHKYTVEQINEWFGLGLANAAIGEMENLGIYCHTNNSGTKLAFGTKNDAVVKDLPMKAGTIKMAQEGLLPVGIMSQIMPKVKGALAICVTQLSKGNAPIWADVGPGGDISNAPADDLEAEMISENKHFQESLVSSMIDEPDEIHIGTNFEQKDEKIVFPDAEAAKDQMVHGEPIEKPLTQFAITEALKMHKVKLLNADTMYQPVNGTSESSIYHCIGLVDGSNLKFGARWTGKNLSIRVEGSVEAVKNALIAAGFNEGYIEQGYTSVHFNAIDVLTARRCIGAVMAGTGFKFLTPMPNIDVIAA